MAELTQSVPPTMHATPVLPLSHPLPTAFLHCLRPIYPMLPFTILTLRPLPFQALSIYFSPFTPSPPLPINPCTYLSIKGNVCNRCALVFVLLRVTHHDKGSSKSQMLRISGIPSNTNSHTASCQRVLLRKYVPAVHHGAAAQHRAWCLVLGASPSAVAAPKRGALRTDPLLCPSRMVQWVDYLAWDTPTKEMTQRQ